MTQQKRRFKAVLKFFVSWGCLKDGLGMLYVHWLNSFIFFSVKFAIIIFPLIFLPSNIRNSFEITVFILKERN